MIVSAVWTVEECNEGLCSPTMIGSIKKPRDWWKDPELSARYEAEFQARKPATSMGDVKEDALEAFTNLGRVEYLKAHPKFFHRLLEKVLVEAPPPQLVTLAFGDATL